MSRTIKHPYEHCKYIMKRYYSKNSVRNSSNALKYFTRRNNRVRTKVILRKIITNPNIIDTVIFNPYYKQEESWNWF